MNLTHSLDFGEAGIETMYAMIRRPPRVRA